jgi:uncharacterized protein (TIGR00159 family)
MKDLFNLFRWQDGLDILVLTYIFYRLYLWLKKKRALRMIVAILVLPFFYILAHSLDLSLSEWGFQNLWSVILIVLVVIFQQEIREVLGSINLPAFFIGKAEAHPSKVVDEILEIAFQMGNKRIGGLIVLQRADELDDFIRKKTILDARVNEDLLVSIFNPQSPLHDGAVVIKGDQIRYAAALLPISQSPILPKEWGTRHRAGIGITEVSDAECIIISEERGEVLLASQGEIQKKKGKEELKEILSDPRLIGDKKDKEMTWLKKFIGDLPIKALFLILVCLLWIFVIGIRKGEISFGIPIEYYSTPQSLVIVGEPPREINVRFRGSQRLLSSVKPDHIRVEINLSSAHSGMNQIVLSEKNINTPSGIIVTNFYPRNIKLQLSPISKSTNER